MWWFLALQERQAKLFIFVAMKIILHEIYLLRWNFGVLLQFFQNFKIFLIIVLFWWHFRLFIYQEITLKLIKSGKLICTWLLLFEVLEVIFDGWKFKTAETAGNNVRTREKIAQFSHTNIPFNFKMHFVIINFNVIDNTTYLKIDGK